MTATVDEGEPTPTIEELKKLVELAHNGVGSDAAQVAFRDDLADWLNEYESQDLDDEDDE